MIWTISQHGWLRGVQMDGDQKVGLIILRPCTPRDRLREGVSTPLTYPVWLASGLKIEEAHRGQGLGTGLLEAGGAKLLTHVGGDVWFGSMQETFRIPPGRPKADIQATWNAFRADYPGATRDGGFLLLTDALGLGA